MLSMGVFKMFNPSTFHTNKMELLYEILHFIIIKLRSAAEELGLKVHMDGARVMNAAVAQNKPLSQVVQNVDSVSFCLSKVKYSFIILSHLNQILVLMFYKCNEHVVLEG